MYHPIRNYSSTVLDSQHFNMQFSSFCVKLVSCTCIEDQVRYLLLLHMYTSTRIYIYIYTHYLGCIRVAYSSLQEQSLANCIKCSWIKRTRFAPYTFRTYTRTELPFDAVCLSGKYGSFAKKRTIKRSVSRRVLSMCSCMNGPRNFLSLPFFLFFIPTYNSRHQEILLLLSLLLYCIFVYANSGGIKAYNELPGEEYNDKEESHSIIIMTIMSHMLLFQKQKR